MDSSDDSRPSKASADDDVQSISRSSREHPEDQTLPLLDSRDAVGMERHRNLMLASLLEDYYRSRALEFLNATNPAQRYTRQSPEVEAVAHRLFTQAGGVLSSSGLISPRATSDEAQAARRRFLTGLDSLVSGSQTPTMIESMRNLMVQTPHIDLGPRPANDLQISLRQPHSPRSHYRSTFREDRILGKGGFGKVYQCYNVLDQKMYAVKKIILPPKLVKSYSNGRHDDLQHILREVKAMAMLDHPNVVRYHATWFEEPQQLPELPSGIGNHNIAEPRSRGRRLLLESHPFDYFSEQAPSGSDGIIFGEDTLSHPSVAKDGTDLDLDNGGWPDDATPALGSFETSSASGSSIFAGGVTESEGAIPHQESLEANVHALYIQMSLYPMTLSQFISPSTSSTTDLRHCFHLVPTLRLISSIHDGLQYIHSKGLIHRDIKPGNIFLSLPAVAFEGGYCNLGCKVCTATDEAAPDPMWLNPRIGDFGLVHQLAKREVPSSSSSVDTETARSAGTTYYQPPRRGEVKDEKIDIFALGVVLVELLCRCETAMERVDMLKDLQTGKIPPDIRRNIRAEGHDADTEDKVIQLVSAMINDDPEQRWSGSQVRERLLELLDRCGG
ncbi:kinase-like protein [Poronia punctata]|nr:kinase-like protein [Poronia punctata]